MTNIVYIATSIDGYIADRNGQLDWLQTVPNPEDDDLGWNDFINSIDAIIMGRNTFETVVGFEGEWPYPIPVFVLSNTLQNIPDKLLKQATLLSGKPNKIIEELKEKGFNNLYIDGGNTIQRFLAEDLIDDLILTRIPIILGGGAPLFTATPTELNFQHIETKVLLNNLVQTHYQRKR